MIKDTIGYNVIYYVWIAYLALFFSSCSVMKSIDVSEIDKHKNKNVTIFLKDKTKLTLKSTEYVIVDSAETQWIEGMARINNASSKSTVIINVQDIRSIQYEDQFVSAIVLGTAAGLLYIIVKVLFGGLGKIKVG